MKTIPASHMDIVAAKGLSFVTTVRPDGRTDVVGLVRWIATRRGDAVRAMRDAVKALQALEEAVATS